MRERTPPLSAAEIAMPGGVFDGARHLYGLRVYFEDTDLSGIVYHANYLRWFERARSDVLRMLNIDQRSAIEQGEGAYAVADVHIKYLRPAKLDDDIVIETHCTDLRGASVMMHQRALRKIAAHRPDPRNNAGQPPQPPQAQKPEIHEVKPLGSGGSPSANSLSVKGAKDDLYGGELLCLADFRVGFVAPNGRARRQPQAWREAFAPIIAKQE